MKSNGVPNLVFARLGRVIVYTMLFGIAVALSACESDVGSESRAPEQSAHGTGPDLSKSKTGLEKIFEYIPDIAETRETVYVLDIARLAQELGISAPSREATTAEVIEYQKQIIVQSSRSVGIFPVHENSWLSGFNSYAGELEETTYDSLGFDARNVEQIAMFGIREPMFREVILGTYSPSATLESLESCSDCLPHDVLEYAGVSYYAWGDDFAGSIKLRFAPPGYDFLGRGGRIFIDDGAAARTLSDEHMHQIIDAARNFAPSLADDPDYALAISLLAERETVDARITSAQHTPDSAIELMEEAWANGFRQEITADELRQQLEATHLLLPFKVAAVGTAFPTSESTLPQTYVVLVHESERDAQENADRLRSRIELDEYLFPFGTEADEPDMSAQSWSDYLLDYEITVQGRALILRASAEKFGNTLAHSLLRASFFPFGNHALVLTE